MKLEEYIRKEINIGRKDFDIRVDEKLNVTSNGLNKIKFSVVRKKKILCLIGFHNWRMTPKFLIWRCERCGEEKEEHYSH